MTDHLDLDGGTITNLVDPTNAQDAATKAYVDTAIAGGTGAVASVNSQTGVVVLDADDIDDSVTTNKFVTATDVTNLGNLTGVNSGDQNLSGLVPYSGASGNVDLGSNTIDAGDFNGVPLTTSGVNTKFLNEAGGYTIPAGAAQEIYPNFISGLQPEKTSATTIKLFAGSIANGSSNPQDVIQIRVTAGLTIDLATVGANGRDTGTLTDNTAWYIYLFGDATGVLPTIAVASQAQSYGTVVVPSGYSISLMAKLPFAFVYKPMMGIPDFRLCGWPSRNLEVRYSDWDATGWEVVNAVTGTGSFVSVDIYSAGANRWAPNNARMVLVQYVLEGVTAAGELRFQLGAGSSKEQIIDYANIGEKAMGREWMTTTSAGIFKYKAPTGMKVTLRILGYRMSEV